MSVQFANAVSYFDHIAFSKIEDVDCWVAGGAVRDFFSIGRPRTDVDVLFPSIEQFNLADRKLSGKYKVVGDNDSAKTFQVDGKPFQIIKSHFYDSPESAIAEFDFTVCCAAVTRDRTYFHETFFVDLARRELVINKISHPLSTLQRMQRYVRKGYWMNGHNLFELAKSIDSLDLASMSPKQLKYHEDRLVFSSQFGYYL